MTAASVQVQITVDALDAASLENSILHAHLAIEKERAKTLGEGENKGKKP